MSPELRFVESFPRFAQTPVAVDEPLVAIDETDGIVFFEYAQLFGRFFGMPEVIGIEKGDKFAGRGSDADIPGFGGAQILRVGDDRDGIPIP